MARLRYNGLKATLGAALTSTGTAVTFAAALTHAGGTAVPTLAGGDLIPLSILDSNGNLVEIVHLTAYTAGATTGTIVRGREGTTGVAHASGASVRHAATTADFEEPDRIINAQTGTTYTVTATDTGDDRMLTLTNAAAITLTLPAGLPVGSTVTFAQMGAGQVTAVAGAGATVQGKPSLKTADQYSVAEAQVIAADTWVVYGRLEDPPHVHAVVRARAKRTTLPPSLANATTTIINWEAEEYDTDGLWAVSPNPSRIVLGKVGLWLVFGAYSYGGNATGRRVSMLRLNGTNYFARNSVYPTSTVAVDVPVSSPVVATAVTDYVELAVYQDSTTTLASAAGTAADNWLAAFYLGS